MDTTDFVLFPGMDALDHSASVTDYENALKKYFNAAYCVSLTSGTAAIIVALQAVGIQPGDEVITSAAAPLCTAFPILSTGAELVFSDCSRTHFGLDIAGLYQSLTRKTKAIVEVPMWGYGIPAEAIELWADEREIPLIFDLAHCAGTRYNGVPLSHFCDIACFSTQKNKMFSTGEGGFLLTDNEAYYQRALSYSRMGNLNGIDFGVNYRLSPYLAEKGISALAQLPESLNLRAQQSHKITALIEHPAVRELEVVPGSVPSYQRLLLQSDQGGAALANYLVKEGIPSDMTKYNIRPLYDYPVLKKYRADCPNTERLLETTTTIPVHQRYTPEQLAQMATIINNYPY